MNITLLLVLGGMLLTSLVLILGLISFASGGEWNKKYGNKLMTLRVVLQAATLALLGFAAILSGT